MAGDGEAVRVRVRRAKKPVVLTTNAGGFMCRSDYAVDLAFMLSRAEGFLAQHRMADRMQLGELLVSYVDGEMTPEEVRREIDEWASELTEDDAGRHALAADAAGRTGEGGDAGRPAGDEGGAER